MNAITKQQVLDVFHTRASTRAYDPNKKISEEDFNYILELGRLSPSSVGSEPWKFASSAEFVGSSLKNSPRA